MIEKQTKLLKIQALCIVWPYSLSTWNKSIFKVKIFQNTMQTLFIDIHILFEYVIYKNIPKL